MLIPPRTPSFPSCFGVACAVFVAFALAWTAPCLADTPPASTGGLDEELEAAPSRWERLKSLVTDVLTPESETVDKVSASTRGDDLVIRADPYRDGSDGRNRLVAGARPLHVRWQGGTAPFRLNLLKLEDGAKRPVIPETTVQTRSADLPSVDLQPGNYVLVIKDAEAYEKNPDPLFGPAVVMDLEALSAEARPSMPADLAETPCSQALKDLLYADWLSKQGKGEWTLEAMQLVAPLAAGSQKAAAWMDRWGGK